MFKLLVICSVVTMSYGKPGGLLDGGYGGHAGYGGIGGYGGHGGYGGQGGYGGHGGYGGYGHSGLAPATSYSSRVDYPSPHVKTYVAPAASYHSAPLVSSHGLGHGYDEGLGYSNGLGHGYGGDHSYGGYNNGYSLGGDGHGW
ncbi:uncharacterized protein LOC126881163 [Diabrotica virgifera virgifera]|uniref:Uncharacterized protein n=1 Tax=Diabrotica virgifera virgifera TaxID=50390 RepID=A0ABM5JTD2_DIAVI|nr:uncharacterized protein LOC126881163 [Diabrotica virgifera virgifera]